VFDLQNFVLPVVVLCQNIAMEISKEEQEVEEVVHPWSNTELTESYAYLPAQTVADTDNTVIAPLFIIRLSDIGDEGLTASFVS